MSSTTVETSVSAAASASAVSDATAAGGAGLESATPASAMSRAMRQCMKMVDYAKRNSPRVAALVRKLEARGCGATPIVCEDIFGGAATTGGYHFERKVVIMNPSVPERFFTQHIWTRGISHELVHAYDDCRADLNGNDMRHMACTEIRAANLSGDCDFSEEFSRSGFLLDVAGRQQKCVRKRTLQSLAMNSANTMSREEIEKVIDHVFPACYKDTAPFPTN